MATRTRPPSLEQRAAEQLAGVLNGLPPDGTKRDTIIRERLAAVINLLTSR